MLKVLCSKLKVDKLKFPGVPQKHLQWAQHFSKHAAVINGVLMYHGALIDNPNHYRCVVPDVIRSGYYLPSTG